MWVVFRHVENSIIFYSKTSSQTHTHTHRLVSVCPIIMNICVEHSANQFGCEVDAYKSSGRIRNRHNPVVHLSGDRWQRPADR